MGLAPSAISFFLATMLDPVGVIMYITNIRKEGRMDWEEDVEEEEWGWDDMVWEEDVPVPREESWQSFLTGF